MKRNLFIVMMTAILSTMGTHHAFAYDIAVENEGKTIYYNYSSDGMELSVTYLYYDYNYSAYRGDVVIPDEVTYMNRTRKVTSIGDRAFQSCPGLTSVTIPNSVTSIGSDAFYSCDGLTSVHISDIAAWCKIEFTSHSSNPLYYAHHLYLNDKEVKDLVIPNSVTSIGRWAFQGCSGLTSVTIPNSVASIGNYAFYGCSSLTSVTIGNSVTSIGSFAFEGCSGLTSVTIPNSVTSIDYYAFSGCTGLTSITIGNSVTYINSSAFRNCTSLTSVALFCECVDTWFSGYKSIIEVTCGEGVKTIKDKAFNGCTALKTINIGSTVDSIGSRAFAGSDKLTDVTCKAVSIPETAKTAFENSYPEYADLHVPSVSVSAYQETAPWNKFNHIIAITNEVPDDAEQCATPTITYSKGMLSFRCTTEGAECISTIEDSDIGTYSVGDVQLTVTYTVSVYARKERFKDSEMATATLCWIDVQPQTEGVEVATTMQSIEARPVLIQTNGQVVSISGAPEGSTIAIYDVAGQLVGSGKATAGTTDISTQLCNGDIAIVKIGSKAVKVVVK